MYLIDYDYFLLMFYTQLLDIFKVFAIALVTIWAVSWLVAAICFIKFLRE